MYKAQLYDVRFNAIIYNAQLLSFTRGTIQQIQRHNDVKQKLMSQANRLAWYQTTNSTSTHG